MEILNENCSSIRITSSILDSIPVGGVTKITVQLNCCSTLLDAVIVTPVSGAIVLPASIFGWTTIKDGVYSIKVVITTLAQPTLTDSNCAFIDCDFKCELSKKLESLLAEDHTPEKQEALQYTMLHYALTTTSNCGCNCQELCDLYKQLYKLVNGADLFSSNETTSITNQISDCGCN
jgi:hypothetical protein